jgi:hypothetical protein
LKRRFPNEILGFLKRHKKDGGLLMFDGKIFEDWSWDDQKEMNLGLFEPRQKGKMIVPPHNPARIILFPNFGGKVYPKGVISDKSSSSIDMCLLSKSKEGGNFYFFDEFLDRKIKAKSLVSSKLFWYSAFVGNSMALVLSTDQLDERKVYECSCLFMPAILQVDGMNVMVNRYLIIKKKEIKEDFSSVRGKRFRTVQDLSPVWDFDKNINVYSDVETFIILSACFYMMESIPAINLVLCGASRSKKTAFLDMFSRIFSDEITTSQWASSKGMIVSFYGQKPVAGALFKANYVSLVDEFFRRFLNTADKMGTLNALRNGLTEFMNVLEHKNHSYPSGKGSINLALRTSFLATDNSIYRKELPDLWKMDNAVLRRFTFLLVSPETEERGKNLRMLGVSEAGDLLEKRFRQTHAFKHFQDYAKFARFARIEIANVKISHKEMLYVESFMADLKRKYGTLFFTEEAVLALYRCWCFFQSRIKSGCNRDFFEKVITRLVSDARDILEPETKEEGDWKREVKGKLVSNF